MTTNDESVEPSPLFRITSLCLHFIGYVCLAGSSVFLLKYSLGRPDTAKLTAVAIVGIVASVVGGTHSLVKLFRRRQ